VLLQDKKGQVYMQETEKKNLCVPCSKINPQKVRN